jgi:proteasome-associated ATPase
VLFIDEAESLLRTRSSGRMTNISNTLVPQFCAEMDGMTGLENVIVVLTSNRPDYIDPAILRPGRIDRKIKVRRPSGQDIAKILSIYLTEELPYDPALVAEHGGEACAQRDLVEFAAAQLAKESAESEIVRLTLRSGASRTLFYKDLVSGALLKAIVDRAKDLAITRAIADSGSKHGLSKEDLEIAIREEFRENEILPKSDAVEDWLMLLDFEPEQVVAVKPKRKVETDGVRGII